MWQKLYLISETEDGPIKVGIAVNPKSRCRELQTGSPHALRVLHEVEIKDARAIEARVHGLLSDHHIRGEWFAIGFRAALLAVERALWSEPDESEGHIRIRPVASGGKLLAPSGVCECCDARRAHAREAMKAVRARRARAKESRQ